MGTLHILNRSPYSRPDAKNTLELARPGDGILMIQDALFIFRLPSDDHTIEDALARGLKIYALKVDLEARSVTPPPGVEIVEYDGFVELLTGYERTVS